MENVYINRIGMAAGIVAVMQDGVIRNCSSSGYIRGTSAVGGIVGMGSGIIEKCYSVIEINCGTGNSGGLVGQFGVFTGQSIIKSCYSISTVRGAMNLGGLVGSVNYADILDCYTITNVGGDRASMYIGGVVGYMGAGKINNCYVIGSISKWDESFATCFIGGIAGSSGTELKNCFAILEKISIEKFNRINSEAIAVLYAYISGTGAYPSNNNTVLDSIVIENTSILPRENYDYTKSVKEL